MQSQFNEILQKRMDRKDFLKHVGIGVAALTGVTALIKTLNPGSSVKEATGGYGASAYGGQKTK